MGQSLQKMILGPDHGQINLKHKTIRNIHKSIKNQAQASDYFQQTYGKLPIDLHMIRPLKNAH